MAFRRAVMNFACSRAVFRGPNAVSRVVRPQRLTLGPLLAGPPLVHFLNDCASARIDQHHPLAGIDIAIFGQARTPIRRYGDKFDVARHPAADDDLLPALNRADFVLSNVSLDLGSILRLDFNGGISRAGGYCCRLGRWPWSRRAMPLRQVSAASSYLYLLGRIGASKEQQFWDCAVPDKASMTYHAAKLA